MAYCEHCGAYIPDGQEICLACGFDPAAEKQRAAEAQATAYAYREEAAQREEDLRAELERRRAERQKNDRVWAENERRRRKMEEEFRRAQEEKEKRAESYVHRNKGRRVSVNVGDNVSVNVGDKRVSVNVGGRRYSFGADEPAEDTEQTEEVEQEEQACRAPKAAEKQENCGLAAISYLGVLFFVPLLFGQEDEFVRFHAKQGLKLFLCTVLASAVGTPFGVGWAATLLGIYLAAKGVIAAVNGKKEELPLLKKIKWFSE